MNKVVVGVAIAFLAAACSASVQTISTPGAGGGGSPSIALSGSGSGEKMKLGVVAIKDPAKAQHPAFFKPPKGDRFVAVVIRLTNVGTANYNDSPSNGAVIIGTSGHQYQADIMDPVAGGFEGGSAVIAKGDSRVGTLTFDVPKSDQPASFQFTLDSGFGPDTGQCGI